MSLFTRMWEVGFMCSFEDWVGETVRVLRYAHQSLLVKTEGISPSTWLGQQRG